MVKAAKIRNAAPVPRRVVGLTLAALGELRCEEQIPADDSLTIRKLVGYRSPA